MSGLGRAAAAALDGWMDGWMAGFQLARSSAKSAEESAFAACWLGLPPLHCGAKQPRVDFRQPEGERGVSRHHQNEQENDAHITLIAAAKPPCRRSDNACTLSEAWCSTKPSHPVIRNLFLGPAIVPELIDF